jgi:hypothetical protein
MTITEKMLYTTQSAGKSGHPAPQDDTAGSRAAYYAFHLGQEVQRHHQHCLAWQGSCRPDNEPGARLVPVDGRAVH